MKPHVCLCKFLVRVSVFDWSASVMVTYSFCRSPQDKNLASQSPWWQMALLTQWKKSDGECARYDVSLGTGAASVPSVHWLITLLLVKAILSGGELMAQQRRASGWKRHPLTGSRLQGGDRTWRVFAVWFDSFLPPTKLSFCFCTYLCRHLEDSQWSKWWQDTKHGLCLSHMCSTKLSHMSQVALMNVLFYYLCYQMYFQPQTYPPWLSFMISVFWHLPGRPAHLIHIYVYRPWPTQTHPI